MIGERIKKLRLQHGMSLTELAERAGVAKSYISSIERNLQSNPSIQVLEKIATVFHTTAENLLKENQEPVAVDNEWMQILKEAMESGVSKEEFKNFIEFNKFKQGKQ
ncbi:helix-turn-helix domain-containing protein [Bacillus sp. RG28]|jgi:XRE family transcriptional regulator of biofilm formation|uniref:Helix-turn-helix domain-containing protein n=1 Tax=Gottfriedia endophytica TaxID=2820819 RepID=A0A940NP36_9BACI|nr:helix-turn-helix domain-containing protein [Gottfriedia endophytica]MBP0725115.1 helix-turn-helix domain-containing protein [Gottfriedia endophytica]